MSWDGNSSGKSDVSFSSKDNTSTAAEAGVCPCKNSHSLLLDKCATV